MAEYLLSNTAGSLQMAKQITGNGEHCTYILATSILQDSRFLYWYRWRFKTSVIWCLATGKYCNYWCFWGACSLYLLVLSLSSQHFLECLDSDTEKEGSQLIQNVTIYQVARCHITDDLTVHQFSLYRHTNLSSVPQIRFRNYVLQKLWPLEILYIGYK